MIYLDDNATTPLVPEVAEAMMPYLDANYGNPSSAHSLGRSTKAAIESARESVGGLLGAASSSEVVFTSGGTESDNWAILGALEANPSKKHIVTAQVEHEAVRKLCQKLANQGYGVTWLGVDSEGSVDLGELRESISEDTAVVSVMMANNETGVLFPVGEIAEIVKSKSNALFHVDGVNAAGKVPIDLKNTQVDLFSISAHKFYGPKGIGALYIRQGVELPSMSIGGGQESGRRAGTEAVHQIAGLGAAAKFASDLSVMEDVAELRDALEKGILESISNTSVNGTLAHSKRLPNTSNISFENINGEMIMFRLDDAGICVSTGSACHSADHSASSVLTAMNVPYSKAMGSIRFSLGRFNTDEEIGVVNEKLTKIVAELRTLGN